MEVSDDDLMEANDDGPWFNMEMSKKEKLRREDHGGIASLSSQLEKGLNITIC